jgi:hypothetical protein
MPATALPRDTWKQYHREPLTYDGVAVCIYVEEISKRKISVELIPEDEDESDRWPLDVLRLPKAKQQAILKQLR